MPMCHIPPPGDHIPVRFPISCKVPEDGCHANILLLSFYIKTIFLTLVLIYVVFRDNETSAENAMMTTHALVEDIKWNHTIFMMRVEEGKMGKGASSLPAIVWGILFFTKYEQITGLQDLIRPWFVFSY